MIENRYRMSPLFKEAFKVIGRGVGAVELDERGLNQNDLSHRFKPIG